MMLTGSVQQQQPRCSEVIECECWCHLY